MKKLVSLLLVASLLLIGTFAATAEETKKWEGHHIVYASWGDGAERPRATLPSRRSKRRLVAK